MTDASKVELGPPGEMFDVGGRRMHALVTGELRDKKPVVLEAGLTAMSTCWHWVQKELSHMTKALSYDRAGLGWSDPSLEPKDANTIAKDLHRLLDAANFPKPFVLVGHSMGGIFSRAYASIYPGDVAGLTLIDASHPEQIERSPNIKRSLRRFFRFLRATPFMNTFGIDAGDFSSSAPHLRATVREASEWFTSSAQVKDKNLGDVPLVAVTAPEKCMPGWLEMQKELAQISTRGRHVFVDGASHITILTHRDYARRVAHEALTLA